MKCTVAQFIGGMEDGGAETLVKEYCLQLDRNKFNIFVITLRSNLNTANERILLDSGVKIVSIYKNNSTPFKIVQKLNGWWYIPMRLAQILVQENVDVIHVHLALLKYLGRIWRLCKRRNIRLFYTCHSLPEKFFLGKRRTEGSAAKRLIQSNGLQLIALHDDMKKQMDAMFHIGNTVVIRNGVDFSRFENVRVSRDEVRGSLNISHDAFVVGHIGRFSVQKNHDFLIDIFAEVYKRNHKAYLLLVGAGKLVENVKAKLERLNLTGRALILSHRADIPELLKVMDVFVFPSKFEGLGIVLIEAQVSGLRCVISDTVPGEAFKTELAIPVSLNEPPEKWCDIIFDNSVKGVRNGGIDDYNMRKEIKRLERLYSGEWDE